MITEPQDAADYIHNLLLEHQGPLGVGAVLYGEKLRPEYPAIVVTPGAKSKIVHATHTFLVTMEVVLSVYHARLNASHAQRTREDLELVTAIENLIERGEMNAGGEAIFVFVSDAFPGVVTRPTGDQVVGTRMIVNFTTQKGFPYGP